MLYACGQRDILMSDLILVGTILNYCGLILLLAVSLS